MFITSKSKPLEMLLVRKPLKVNSNKQNTFFDHLDIELGNSVLFESFRFKLFSSFFLFIVHILLIHYENCINLS